MRPPAKPPMLPPCPVCGKPPVAGESLAVRPSCRFERGCTRTTDTTYHDICTAGRTQAEADARWRRLAGGGAK